MAAQVYSLEQTMRWFGPQDPVNLADLRQAGCPGVVTALHHLPNGAVWPVAEIRARAVLLEQAGLRCARAAFVAFDVLLLQRPGAAQ